MTEQGGLVICTKCKNRLQPLSNDEHRHWQHVDPEPMTADNEQCDWFGPSPPRRGELQVALVHVPISPEEWAQRRERFKKLMAQQIVDIIDQGLIEGRFIAKDGKLVVNPEFSREGKGIDK